MPKRTIQVANMKLNDCISYHMKLTGCLPLCSFQRFCEAGCKDWHFLEYLLYLDQCHLYECGNRVPYFLKCFVICVLMDKGVMSPPQCFKRAYMHSIFFCDGCILVVFFYG